MKQKEQFLVSSDEVSKIDLKTIRAAASNASKVQEIALEIPVVNPKDLSIEDQIFGIVLNSVNDKESKTNPDSSLYPAILPILVDTLSGRAKPGFITVNGTIDIPKEQGRVSKLEECYFTRQEEARAVCRVIVEVELERSMKKEEEQAKITIFLKDKIDNDRF